MELARFETMHENSRGRFASQSEEDEHLEYHSDTLEEPTFPQVLGAPQKNVKLQKMHKTCRKKCKKKRSSVAGGAAGSKIANSDGSPLSGIHKNIQQRRSDHFSPNLTDSSIVSSNDSRSRFPCDDAFESPKTGRYLQAQFNDDNEKLLSGFYDDEDDDRDEPKVLKYIDTHCHLDLLFHRTKCLNKCDEYSLDDFRMKPEIVRTWSPNFGGCITDFCFPEDNSYSKALNSVKKCDDVWTAIGCHPHSADKYTTQLEAQIYQLASDPKVVAVGEMGLDESKKLLVVMSKFGISSNKTNSDQSTAEESVVASNPFDDPPCSQNRVQQRPFCPFVMYPGGPVPPIMMGQHRPAPRLMYLPPRPIAPYGFENAMHLQHMGVGPIPGMMEPRMYPPDQAMIRSSNPNAPPTYICKICRLEIHDNEQSVFCGLYCKRFFHRTCVGLAEDAWQALIVEAQAEWICDSCFLQQGRPMVRMPPNVQLQLN
uniref:PHD-type domain-containing protein n=1 Tax=Romanomermis culicivorax TaxID=13658 RepID=A0A915IJY3_ROMCU